MLHIKTGDLFESEAEVIVNPVNCQGIMGKGVAVLMKERFPNMFNGYVRQCRNGEYRPGIVHLYIDTDVKTGLQRKIVNFPTKDAINKPSHSNYIAAGLKATGDLITTMGIKSIAFPALGCGYGQLKWKDVLNIFESWHVLYPSLYDVDIELYAPKPG